VIKDRRLGRGLAALLGAPLEPEASVRSGGDAASAALPAGESERRPGEGVLEFPRSNHGESSASTAAEATSMSLLQLPVGEIEENPFQPRREFSDVEIASLAESLKEHDMLQPILVRKVAGRYQLISGERRLRAARQAGWTTIPARLREADDRLVAELAIVENLQRKDLNPVEKALSFKRYLDEHHCTQDDLARRLKIDRSTIANLMRLLELPPEILTALRKGLITAGHARALLPLGDEHEQLALSKRIEEDGLSVRDVERIVAERVGQEEESPPDILPGPTAQARTQNDQLASLEQEFRHALGMKVELRANARGRGKLVIHFQNHEEFDRLREQVTGAPAANRKAA
jgi:ParB family transcriptional regulator, chromosome partitioning protein